MAKSIPFPIRTKTSCLLKWNWSTILLKTAETSSCHRNWKIPLSLEDFDNFHNLPYKIDHRQSMLNGEWPNSPNHKGCYYCKEIEDSGARSDRQFMTETMTDQTPDELESDPTATHVTPAVLEVFVDNVCNMSCTYCDVSNSSLIEARSRKSNNPAFDEYYFGKLENNISNTQLDLYFQKLLQWLQKNGTSLRRFHILGGEPFFQKQLDPLLNVWEDYPNSKLVLNLVSNMNVNETIFKKYIDKIVGLCNQKKIERFDLTASIDCWGNSQEYVRTGFRSNVVEKNMLYALKQNHITMNINSTHSLMSIDTYSNLLRKKQQWENTTNKKIRMYGMIVDENHVDPRMLGGEFFKDSIAQIRKSHPISSWDDRESYKNINGILSIIENSQPSPENMKHFLTVYNELDKRNNTNWRKTFPRISEEIQKYIIL